MSPGFQARLIFGLSLAFIDELIICSCKTGTGHAAGDRHDAPSLRRCLQRCAGLPFAAVFHAFAWDFTHASGAGVAPQLWHLACSCAKPAAAASGPAARRAASAAAGLWRALHADCPAPPAAGYGYVMAPPVQAAAVAVAHGVAAPLPQQAAAAAEQQRLGERYQVPHCCRPHADRHANLAGLHSPIFMPQIWLLLKLAVAVCVINQDGSRRHMAMFAVFAGLIYAHQVGLLAPVLTWLSRAAGAPIADAVQPGGAEAAPPQSPSPASAHTPPQPPAPPRGGLLCELKLLVFTFCASLLPGWQAPVFTRDGAVAAQHPHPD